MASILCDGPEIKDKYYQYCYYCQKVVVLQDVSNEVSWDAIRWMIHDFSLKEGDELTLVGVLHQVTNPMGFKCKIDQVSWKFVEEEIARKKEDLSQQIFIHIIKDQQCGQMRFRVNVEVVAGPCPKMAAAEAANKLSPTWVLLDRKLKKDSKYFLEKLIMSCGISKVTGHNTVQQLRAGPDQIIHEDSSTSTTCSVCNNKRPDKMMDDKRRMDFSYGQLYAATSGFSQEKYLSEGGFGSVYEGKLKKGTKIAVKKLSDDSFQGEKEFRREVKALSNARHKNVVMLLGSCSEGNHRLLVYEYICNGSLDRHLSNDEVMKGLCWDERIKIAFGAAKGLEYLHSKDIIHRDVRPSNILITHDYQSLLGDFGLAKTQQQLGDSDNNNKGVLGTFGYLAPEYAVNGYASAKTDVYSYGVVLLQLITGFSTTNNIHGGGESLLDWARPLLKSREYPALIDKRILDSHDVHQLFWMVWVAEKCLEVEPRKRWTMPTVVSALNYIVEGGNATFIHDFFSPAHSDTVDSILNYSGGESDDDDSNMKMLINNNNNDNNNGSLMMMLVDDQNHNIDEEFVCPTETKTTSKSVHRRPHHHRRSKMKEEIPQTTRTAASSAGESLYYDEMVV